MTMYMDGFHFSLLRQQLQCLIFIISPWDLDDRGSFQGAMVFCFLSAVLFEIFSALQVYFRSYRLIQIVFYGIQALWGYFLMYVVMTMSIELIASQILGLMVGHIMCVSTDKIIGRNKVQRRRPQYENELTAPLLQQ